MGAPARRSSPPPVPPSSPKPAGGRARSAGTAHPADDSARSAGRRPRAALLRAQRPRPGQPCRSSSSAAPHVRAAAVPGGPGRTDVDAVVDDNRDDRPRRSGCPRSCRPRRPPASPPPPGGGLVPLTRLGDDGHGPPPPRGGTRFGRQTRCRHPRGRPTPGGVVSVMSPGLALRQVGSQESSAGEFRRAGLARREAGWTVSR